jgi:hypothetical protein
MQAVDSAANVTLIANLDAHLNMNPQGTVPPEAVLFMAPSALDGQPQRHIRHPGTPDATMDVQRCRLRRVLLADGLPTGLPLIEALSQALAAHGVSSAVLRLPDASGDLQLDPFAYVLPALSRDPAHAVYFSERHQAPGSVQVLAGAITVGRHGDQPWLHGHLDWIEIGDDGQPTTGQRRCGHVLPNEAMVVRADQPIEAWALEGAAFEVVPDEFTRFSLFKPQARAVSVAPGGAQGEDNTRPALAIRVPPNVDLCLALEAVCRERDITAATLRGGVGSTVGVVFDDGQGATRNVEPFVTETLVRQGRVFTTDAASGGELRAEVDVTLIDYLGGHHSGRLARGRNPVLVTFELVLELH